MATTKKTTADGPRQSSKHAIAADSLEVMPRLYRQIARLLDQLEKQDILEDGVTVPQRISALIATGRIMKMFQDLRKGEFNAGAGSAIDKYSTAFTTPHDASRGNKGGRPTLVQLGDADDPEPGDPDYLDA